MKDRSGKAPRLGCKGCKATGLALDRDELCKRCRRKPSPAPKPDPLCQHAYGATGNKCAFCGVTLSSGGPR